MKILYISLSAAPGGGPEHIYRLTQQLKNYGVEIYFAAPDEEPYAARFSHLATTHDVCLMPSRKLSLPAFFRLLRYIKKYKIDIIHSHGKGAGIYARLAGLICHKPVIHTFHGLHFTYPKYILPLYKWFERQFGAITAASIAVSESEAQQVRAHGFSTERKLHVIPNGVFIPKAVQEMNKTPFSLVHITRFGDPAKNSEAIVKLVVSLANQTTIENFRFIFIGTGEKQKTIQQELAQLGLAQYCQFIGYTPQPRHYLAGAGCAISLSRWEGMPLALLEALSEGVPCIATDVVGNKDIIIHGETGFLFPLEKVEQAIPYIIQLATQDGLRRVMGTKAYAYAKEYYSIETMTEKTMAVYEKVYYSKS